MSAITRNALPGGFALIEFDEIDSTNAEALRRLDGGEAPHFAVRANRQTAGRGRRGSHWVSEPGNLHASFGVALPSQANPGHLAFVSAVAVGDALRDLAPGLSNLGYKWPNDLVIDHRKLAGILIEAVAGHRYVVGIGLNLESAPHGVLPPAISLRDAAEITVSPKHALSSVCAHFADWRDRWLREGFAPVRAAWLECAVGIGREVDVRLPDRSVRGVYAGIDESGVLLLDMADGSRCEIAAGAVFFSGAEAAKCC